MIRRIALVLALCVLGSALGCEKSSEPAAPKTDLEYSKDPPPKRGVPGAKQK